MNRTKSTSFCTGILLALLVLNGCQDKSEVSRQDLPSPRSQVNEYVGNLTDSDFRRAIEKNRRYIKIASWFGAMTPEYESRPNGGDCEWRITVDDIDGSEIDTMYHRLTLEIKDYSFNNSEQKGEIVFEVSEGGYDRLKDTSTSSRRTYKVSFFYEDERFVLDKVLVTYIYKNGNKRESLWNHRDDPSIETLLGKLIEF